MPVYSISYDLVDASPEDYTNLEEKIVYYSSKRIKYCETSWLCKYSGTSSQFYENLKSAIKDTDSILIVKVVKPCAGQVTKEILDDVTELCNEAV